MIIIRKKYKFCAAHRYKNPSWDEEKNIKIFGDDYKVHGHNYLLEVSLKGPVDMNTGFVVDLNYVNDIVYKEIIKVIDHSNIQEDIKWFKDKRPSSENLAIYVWEKLINKIKDPVELYCIKIEETPTISSEYYGKE